MDRARKIAGHVTPNSMHDVDLDVAAIAPVVSASDVTGNSSTVSDAVAPSDELILKHRQGTASLWDGPKAHQRKAMDIFFTERITNFPLIDVAKETRIALERVRALLRSAAEAEPKAIQPAKHWGMERLFITGATGFVGVHLLLKLVRHFPLAQLFCLVRGRNAEHCVERLRAQARSYHLEEAIGEAGWARIFGIPGDITKPQLGLSPADFAELSVRTQTVVHLAARDNFFLPYKVLAQSHVDGMMSIVDFCARGCVKSLLYVSSCKIRLIEELQGQVVPTDGLYDGYAQSKSVGHYIAEEVRRCSGEFPCVPPICLVNLGYVFSDRIPPPVPDITDAWEVVTKICLICGVVPENEASMDFAPVDYVTDCFVEILDDYIAGTGLKQHGKQAGWLEIFAPETLKFSEVAQILEEYCGHPLRRVSTPDFAEYWRQVLWEAGTPQSKCLSVCVTDTWDKQCCTVLSAGPENYRSRLHPNFPKVSREFLLQLVRTIDTKMSLR